MKIKLRTVGIALSLFLLNGCGGSSNTSTQEDANTSTQEDSSTSTVSKLEGTWIENGGCHIDGMESEYITITFKGIDSTLLYKEYEGTTCDESKLTYHSTGIYEFIEKEETTALDQKSAKEINFTLTEFSLKKGTLTEYPKVGTIFYAMYRIDKKGRLLLSNETNELNDGSSEEKRMNNFEGTDFYTK
jgi:hypothetical protein